MSKSSGICTGGPREHALPSHCTDPSGTRQVGITATTGLAVAVDGGGAPHDATREGSIGAAAAADEPQVEDAAPLRLTLDTSVDALRAEAGLPALSAAMDRRRRAFEHQRKTLEDPLLQAAAGGAQVTRGTCAYCRCDFSVVPAVDMPEGSVCSGCGSVYRAYNPQPVLRAPPANAEERWKGWLPW
ncbi:hypothetical protein BS78_03G352800 [Paspalum vaginatum]|nr:hypothetical protein BS78_03G352800 [Paspalum vaginatum]